MCGIVGAVAKRSVANILLEGLKRLEYRGYDSAGLAVIQADASIGRRRTQGKVRELEAAMRLQTLEGNLGIAHTRWATHGLPAEHNAHPHISNDDIALVHNGIIENHEALRDKLTELNYHCESETDSELIAHLIHYYRGQGKSIIQAVQAAVAELEGAFALGVIDKNEPEILIAVRQGCPLVIGLGENENFIASDNIALLPVTEKFIYLEEGDVAELRYNKLLIIDAEGHQVSREVHISKLNYDVTNKGGYRHYMLKEIHEQPEAIADTLGGRISKDKVLARAFGEKALEIFNRVERVQIVACGTSYHAGMVAKYWLEEIAEIPCQIEVASEYRYHKAIVSDNTLFVTISQSGETADTLAALRLAKKLNYLGTLAICNVPESSLVRASDLTLMTRAGVEIGVASTKAFTTQLVALMLLTLVLGKKKISAQMEKELVQELAHLPELCREVLTLDEKIKVQAQDFADKDHALFLGRGFEYPIALEGALKLKEISYIHAEGYPAGELKHGPLALVDKNMPVVAVAPNDELLDKLKSNLHEVRARGGQLYVYVDNKVKMRQEEGLHLLEMPTTSKYLAPIIYTLPLQLLAYHVAVLKGTDIDQPRNLAKSVTVE